MTAPILQRVARSLAAALALLLLGVASVPAQPGADAVALTPMTYAELGKLVRGLKGKVVVVDFWADFCIPCKKEFPHLVELQRRYGKDGFVAVSVSVDPPEDEDARKRALAFLKKQQATFTNVLLTETPAVWQKQLGIDGPPCLYVFNRDNRFVLKQSGDEVDYEVVERTVQQLLRP